MRNWFLFLCIVCVTILTTQSANAQKYLKFENSVSSTDFSTISPLEALPAIQYVTTTAATVKASENHFSSLTESCKKLQFKFSILLDREVEKITNTLMYGFINDWFGTRYLYGGTGRKGIDCSAYVGLLINTVFAFKLPRTARLQYAATKRVALKDMKEGDLVFFNTTGGISHVGVYLGDGYFTHSSSSKGVTINNLSESYYKARFIGGGRIDNPEVENMQNLMASVY